MAEPKKRVTPARRKTPAKSPKKAAKPRVTGKPSPVTLDNGTVEWRLPNGRLHREGGPAVKRLDGSEGWFYDGEHHREGGPAIIATDGFQAWMIHGEYQKATWGPRLDLDPDEPSADEATP